LQPIPAWRWTLAALVVFAAVAVGVTMWLLAVANQAKAGSARASAELDAVRTGLAAGAGAGAAVGLILAFRRQHHEEVSTILTDQDATERRITELYTKAVEQLGSEKAPVRLGGLYALERLAQDNPAHRQTIVNVICAYLRMPFSPTAPASEPVPQHGQDAGELASSAEAVAPADTADAWQQEKQVRLTAQRVLGEHLNGVRHGTQDPAEPASDQLWHDIHLDLTGATLIDFGLHAAVLAGASFGSATFTGRAWFHGTTFNGNAWFDKATFTGEAVFTDVTFTTAAEFGKAAFNDNAAFDKAAFKDHTLFREATFKRFAVFRDAIFSGDAQFGDAIFSGDARFNHAIFSGDAGFAYAIFSGDGGFPHATFSRDARFNSAAFSGLAGFGDATFSGGAWFDCATFSGNARFDRAAFSGYMDATSFAGSDVRSPDARHVWPQGWGTRETGDGGHTVVRVGGSVGF
jgi:hypothetical protein